MKRLILIALLTAPLAAISADDAYKGCSTKASMTSSKADLAAMAKVKEADARKTALGTAGSGASITKGGIETEDGCLVYSFHVKGAGEKGQTEVIVDAGNGKVLERDKEGAFRTALEKPIDKTIDKTKELASKAKDKLSSNSSNNTGK
jgi:uncharacterized membrane protein YkoI